MTWSEHCYNPWCKNGEKDMQTLQYRNNKGYNISNLQVMRSVFPSLSLMMMIIIIIIIIIISK